MTLTADGASHPVMRLGAGAGRRQVGCRSRRSPVRRRSARSRPGAQALALVRMPDGPRPLVAVQRYGQGRSMVFTGEASWRWRMQMPSGDRTYELFWRQAARWVGAGAPDRVSIAAPSGLVPGNTAAIGVDVRERRLRAGHRRAGIAQGHAPRRRGPRSSGRAHRPAVGTVRRRDALRRTRRVSRERRSRGWHRSSPGMSDRWLLVGGADLEMADPRLNEQVLQRIARSQRRSVPAGGSDVRAVGDSAISRARGICATAAGALAQRLDLRRGDDAAVGRVGAAPALGAAVKTAGAAFRLCRPARRPRLPPSAMRW